MVTLVKEASKLEAENRPEEAAKYLQVARGEALEGDEGWGRRPQWGDPRGLQGSHLPRKSAAPVPVQLAAVPMGTAEADAQADVQANAQVSAQAMAQAVQLGQPSAGDTEEVQQHTPIMLQGFLEICS